MKECSFATACMEYFGKKPNQTTAEFVQELKQLTDADRAELSALFPSVGYTIR